MSAKEVIECTDCGRYFHGSGWQCAACFRTPVTDSDDDDDDQRLGWRVV